MNDNEPLTVVGIEAENFKRLRAVQLTVAPGGGLIEVSGRNGQGKSSLMDGMRQALAGKDTKGTPKPIRDGEDHAFYKVDLEEFSVRRDWYASGESRITVVSKDGMVPRVAQAFLDDKLGKLSFDPMAFIRMSPKDQVASLLTLVELPFNPDDIRVQRDMLYGRRTDVGRTVKGLQGQLSAIPDPGPDVPDDEIITTEIFDAMAAAEKVRLEHDRIRAALPAAITGRDRLETEVEYCKTQLATAESALLEAEVVVTSAYEAITVLDAPPDTESFRDQLAEAQAVNERVRAKRQRSMVALDCLAFEEKYQELSDQIETIDRNKAVALAEADMPVPGLAFDDDGVTVDGIPLGQCSTAQQIRVSMAMAIKANPKIGIAFIRDGSLLDDDSMALVATMAEESGHQIWIERIASSGAVGFAIEDGQVIE